jgi:hypothetical protein
VSYNALSERALIGPRQQDKKKATPYSVWDPRKHSEYFYGSYRVRG